MSIIISTRQTKTCFAVTTKHSARKLLSNSSIFDFNPWNRCDNNQQYSNMHPPVHGVTKSIKSEYVQYLM